MFFFNFRFYIFNFFFSGNGSKRKLEIFEHFDDLSSDSDDEFLLLNAVDRKKENILQYLDSSSESDDDLLSAFITVSDEKFNAIDEISSSSDEDLSNPFFSCNPTCDVQKLLLLAESSSSDDDEELLLDAAITFKRKRPKMMNYIESVVHDYTDEEVSYILRLKNSFVNNINRKII